VSRCERHRPKYKAAFATAYGAGLRASEVVALKVGDVDSERIRGTGATRAGG
jgi:integrase